MNSSKLATLKPLLESKGGLHMTAYLSKDQDRTGLRKQLRSVLESTLGFVRPALSPEDAAKFVEPLKSLLKDDSCLDQMPGNIGLFRTRNSFRLLHLPIDVEPSCIVATSFHVKPLLKWLQLDRSFLLLGVSTEGPSALYFGDQGSLQTLETFDLPDPRTSSDFEWYVHCLDERLKFLAPGAEHRLFIAGDPKLVRSVMNIVKYPHRHDTLIWPKFSDALAPWVASQVRMAFSAEFKMALSLALTRFHEAERTNLAKKNVFQIARAAVSGKVKTLIVADNVQLFGKIGKGGTLEIHHADLDHEDDDILDDLAQTVLARGGEVFVTESEMIPKGHPVLAILKPTGHELEERIPVNFTDPTIEGRAG